MRKGIDEILNLLIVKANEVNDGSDISLSCRWQLIQICKIIFLNFDGKSILPFKDDLIYLSTSSIADLPNKLKEMFGRLENFSNQNSESLPFKFPEELADRLDISDISIRKFENDLRIEDLLYTVKQKISEKCNGILKVSLLYRVNLLQESLLIQELEPKSRLEIIQCLNYLQLEDDCIPDAFPLIGFIDDDYLVRKTLRLIKGIPEEKINHWSEMVALAWRDLEFSQGLNLIKGENSFMLTWLDRLNSYYAYDFALNGSGRTLFLLQPTIYSSPLQLIITLIELYLYEYITSGKNLETKLIQGANYLIEAEVVQFLEEDKINGRLIFGCDGEDNKIHFPKLIEDRLRATEKKKLSKMIAVSKVLNRHMQGDAQRAFGWRESIPIAANQSGVIIIGNLSRLADLFSDISSNGVSFLESNLVKILKNEDEFTNANGALAVAVPNFQAVRHLMRSGFEPYAIVVVGYNYFKAGEIEEHFIYSKGKRLPTIIFEVESKISFFDSFWKSENLTIQYSRETLEEIVSIDEGNSRNSTLSSLIIHVSGIEINFIEVIRVPEEAALFASLTELKREIYNSNYIPLFLKYKIFRKINGILLYLWLPAYYENLKEDLWKFKEYLESEQDKAFQIETIHIIREVTNVVIQMIEIFTSSKGANSNLKTISNIYGKFDIQDYLVIFRNNLIRSDSVNELDKEEQFKAISIDKFDSFGNGIIFGWQGIDFARQVVAATPRKLQIFGIESELRKWEQILKVRKPSDLHLIHDVPSLSTEASKTDVFEFDRQLVSNSNLKLDDSAEYMDLIALQLDGDLEDYYIMSGEHRFTLTNQNDFRESKAVDLLAGDKLLIWAGDPFSSTNEELIKVIFQELNSEKREEILKIQEWRKALKRYKEANKLSVSDLQRNLNIIGVERKVQTIEYWIDLDRYTPIFPKHGLEDLRKIFRLIETFSSYTSEDIHESYIFIKNLKNHTLSLLFHRSHAQQEALQIDKIFVNRIAEKLKSFIDSVEVINANAVSLPVEFINTVLPVDFLHSRITVEIG
ncbi:hypothetical protein [Leptospira interrogans]|uniref:hypothetical protein n=1 Tax=Leptospira interrogans TaxID=173 RepID=UPI0007745758|nr:hypothetical protein [Leptospira interrogans]WOT11993.1 hypothetical protein CFY92_0005800 [Leptospira interrogans]